MRQLHAEWEERENELLEAQIANLRRRLRLIRWMQILGAVSLLLCVVAMIAMVLESGLLGVWVFFAALFFMAGSLGCLLAEIAMSGGALEILLRRMEGRRES